ncbi:MAG: ATP-binding protein [bacterium]|nr:ATP-binding protein [bacterium]
MHEKKIETFRTIQERKNLHLPTKLRPLFHTIQPKSSAVLFIGPRGVGKTTFLLDRIKDKHMLFLLADNPLVAQSSLWEMGEAVFNQGYEGIVIDEVHRAKDWSIHLKALYDAFPGKTIWASGSSSIVLKMGVGDLSRRFSRVYIPLLSFREYLMLKGAGEFPIFNPFDYNYDDIKNIVSSVNIVKEFKTHLSAGMRPIFLDWDYEEQLENIIEKIIYFDIPYLVPQITENHFRLLKAVLGHIALSNIPTINIESMCKKWGLSKSKLYQLIDAMHHVGLIRIIYKEGDTSIHSKGAKMFLFDPSMYHVLKGKRGNIRESYVACALREKDNDITASPNEEEGDFIFNNLKLEIGGKKKNRKKSDFVLRDDTELPYKNSIPLWMLGFKY